MSVGVGVKMMTGLAARLGFEPPLRVAAFFGMCWAMWWCIASGTVAAVYAWAMDLNHPGGVFGIAVGVVLLLAAVFAAFVNADMNKWKLSDMLRRAPFLLWCALTDDNETISLWMLLFWPIIGIADLIVSLLLVLLTVVTAVFGLLNLKVRGS